MNSTAITLNELEEKLHTLLDCDAMEMIPEENDPSSRLYIPYMMNNALENYFILEDCTKNSLYLWMIIITIRKSIPLLF